MVRTLFLISSLLWFSITIGDVFIGIVNSGAFDLRASEIHMCLSVAFLACYNSSDKEQSK